MSATTGISWTDRTWNPVVGCTSVSSGCDLCYARTLHNTRHKAFKAGKLQNIPQYAEPFSVVQLMPDRLPDPLHWLTRSRIFVNSMSDLFHDHVPDEFLDQVFTVMALAPQHTFQILTKRPDRMRSYIRECSTRLGRQSDLRDAIKALAPYPAARLEANARVSGTRCTSTWSPLPNVWLGVSCENQEAADIRVQLLLETPAAVRFLSCEPLIGPIDLQPFEQWRRFNDTTGVHGYTSVEGRTGGDRHPDRCLCQNETTPHKHYRERPHRCARCSECNAYRPTWPAQIDWVIVGGESGTAKQTVRPMHPDWARSLRDQCVAARIPFHFKQWGEWSTTGPIKAPQCAVDRSGRIATNVDDRWSYPADAQGTDGWQAMYRVGSRSSGRVLDGRTWDQFPEVRT